jgi:hypothetical protein
MRLSLAVNGQQKARASLTTDGWLGAHVNLSQGVESDSNDRVWLSSTDRSEEPNATHSTWGGVPLVIGDKVEIEILPDGDFDAPDKVSRTTENPNNLFSVSEQARLLFASIKTCDKALWEVLRRAKDVEPEDELHKLRLAVGSVLLEIDRQLISPTLRRHPDLLQLAEELKLR